MTSHPDLLAGLRAALQAHGAWGGVPLQPLPDKGLAHGHVRLAGTGLLARIPKQSQLGLPPAANLRHQQACFERAAAGGHAPRLHAVLPPSAPLPRGALLVEEIDGHPAVLPRELPAIAAALAALHALPLPAAGARAPLDSPADPLRALLQEVQAQAAHLEAVALPAGVRETILAELDLLARDAARPQPPVALVSFDAHPGNFLVRPSGQAVLVDLEKCRYSLPGLDLAHATLYTSTTWDVAARAVLAPADVARFYRHWEAAMGQAAAAARPWHVPLRRAMWLWSLTWCGKWKALSGLPPRGARAGEDWSAAHSDAALAAHVRERVDHYLSREAIGFVQHELAALREALA